MGILFSVLQKLFSFCHIIDQYSLKYASYSSAEPEPDNCNANFSPLPHPSLAVGCKCKITHFNLAMPAETCSVAPDISVDIALDMILVNVIDIALDIVLDNIWNIAQDINKDIAHILRWMCN